MAFDERGPALALSIGVYDGVHLGHQELLRRTVEVARQRGLVPAAITFDPRPQEVLRPDTAPPHLMSLDDRLAAIRAVGIERVDVLHFDPDLARLTAAEFFGRLRTRLDIRALVVGENFRLGHGREAGVEELALLGPRLGWELVVVPSLQLDGYPVSSSRIRAALVERGDVRQAERLLGRAFSVQGEVVHGAGRGRGIGFPTANLQVGARLVIPANGVYCCLAGTKDGYVTDWPAAVSIGIRPTFDAGARAIEAYLIDWDGDLYGRQMRLSFVERLREERKYDSVEALIDQMQLDVDAVRVLLHQPVDSPHAG